MKTTINIINIYGILSSPWLDLVIKNTYPFNTNGLSMLERLLLAENIIKYMLYKWLYIKDAVVTKPSLVLDLNKEYIELYALFSTMLTNEVVVLVAGHEINYEAFIMGNNLHIILNDNGAV